MSLPAPNVRSNRAERTEVPVSNAALTPIFIEKASRIGWAIRNPITPNLIVYLVLVDIAAPATDANAEYALNAGDILTDSHVKGYCGPIWASGSTDVVNTLICTELF